MRFMNLIKRNPLSSGLAILVIIVAVIVVVTLITNNSKPSNTDNTVTNNSNSNTTNGVTDSDRARYCVNPDLECTPENVQAMKEQGG